MIARAAMLSARIAALNAANLQSTHREVYHPVYSEHDFDSVVAEFRDLEWNTLCEYLDPDYPD